MFCVRSLVALLLFVVISAQAAIVVNNPKGNVTLTEVYDYQCPHCHRMYPIVAQLMQNNHDLKVRLIPTGILGRGSVMQAAFAYASTKYPGKFAQFNAASMSGQPLDGKQLVALIKRLGMDKQHTADILHQPWVEQQEKAGIELIQHYHAGVPLFLIYPTAHPKHKTVLIGEQSLKTLQQAVDHARH